MSSMSAKRSGPKTIFTVFDLVINQPIMPWTTDLQEVLKVLKALKSAKKHYALMEIEGRMHYEVEVYDNIQAYGKFDGEA